MESSNLSDNSLAADAAERRKKKPYKELTLQEKVQLIRLAEENAGLSQAAIAEKYSIAKSNVCRILQRKKEYLVAFESAGFAGSRKRKLKSGDTDGLLVPLREQEGNETLRAHMYKHHQISRMFMCRCCNWAFPDKTSLHMHIQSREEGKPLTVPVIGKGMSSEANPEPSPFLPIHSVPAHPLGSLPPAGLHPASLPFFNSQSPMGNNQDELYRLRERLMINSLMAQQGLGLPWLSQLPKPVPTTRPLDISSLPRKEDNVVSKTEDAEKSFQDTKVAVSGSDSDEPKSESSAATKRSESPCENGSSSSTDGSSPSHPSTAHSPVELFKKNRKSPSAFHHLNVDSRPFIVPSSPVHVSPSETHSSVSPSTGCFDCAVYKTKLTMADNKARYLESRANTLQTEAVRAQAQTTSAETTIRVLEGETRALRDHTEQVQRRLLDCQEQALRFVQSDRTSNPQAVIMFLNQLIQSTIIR